MAVVPRRNSRGFFAIWRYGEILISRMNRVSSRLAHRSRLAIAMVGHDHPKEGLRIGTPAAKGGVTRLEQSGRWHGEEVQRNLAAELIHRMFGN